MDFGNFIKYTVAPRWTLQFLWDLQKLKISQERYPIVMFSISICNPHSMRIKHILFLSLHYQFLTYFWHPDVSIFVKSSWCTWNHKFLTICFFFILFKISRSGLVLSIFPLICLVFCHISNTKLLFYTLYSCTVWVWSRCWNSTFWTSAASRFC